MSAEHRPTPKLDALLARLGARLRRSVWLHGLGSAALVAGAWVVFMYVADRVLELPGPIRVFHLALLVAGTGLVLVRTLVKNRSALPGRDGLALLAQRALTPEEAADDLFVGAVQLPRRVEPDAPAAALVARVVQDAEALTDRADLTRVTEPGGPRIRAALGAAAVLGAGAALAVEPSMARIFGARLLGANVPWPRETTLVVEVPGAASGVSVDDSDPEVIRVRAARGTDVPVFVRAEGVVPDVVTLRFEESGATLDVPRGGPESFRTVVPSVQDDLTVRVTGGDDDRGVPRIEVQVLQPPDLAAIAFLVTPPAYSGLEPTHAADVTSVRALAGSSVEVHVAPDPPGARGVARTFPDDAEIALADGTFPVDDPEGADGNGVRPTLPSLRFERTVVDSLRFRFELVDASGLKNPDPALFGIEVFEDAGPEVLLLSPTRTDRAVVAGSAVPLRALVRDDLGVGSIELEVYDGITEDRLSVEPLENARLAEAPRAGTRDAALAARVVEVDGLHPSEPLGEGSVVVLRVAATDGRVPEPNRTESAPISLRIVSRDSYLQRQRDALRLQAETLGRLRDRLDDADATVADLVAATLGDEAEPPGGGVLGAAQNEARRVQGDVASLTRELADIAQGHVFSRIDERSGALEQRLVELTSNPDVRGFSPTVWSTLGAELEAGRLGAPQAAGDLVRLVALGLEGSGERAEAWVEALGRARAAGDDLEAARGALGDAQAGIQRVRESLDALSAQLGEWDSMQSIQARARDILNSSKNLAERLKRRAEGK